MTRRGQPRTRYVRKLLAFQASLLRTRPVKKLLAFQAQGRENDRKNVIREAFEAHIHESSIPLIGLVSPSHRMGVELDEEPLSGRINVGQTKDGLAQLAIRVAHEGAHHAIERAKRLGAGDFDGTGDAMVAETWIVGIQRVFEVMECTDIQKFRFATFLLKGEAYYWWRSIQLRYGESATDKWARFYHEFSACYCPRVYEVAKRLEFTSLTQGDMPVGEYINKFIELSQYDPLIAGDVREKCKKFEEGLQGRIRAVVAGNSYMEFEELAEAAMEIERQLSNQLSDCRNPRGGQRSRCRNCNRFHLGPCWGNRPGCYHYGQTDHFKIGSQPSDGRNPRGGQHSLCKNCKRFHSGPCRGNKPGCYHCGQTDHFKRECPN